MGKGFSDQLILGGKKSKPLKRWYKPLRIERMLQLMNEAKGGIFEDEKNIFSRGEISKFPFIYKLGFFKIVT